MSQEPETGHPSPGSEAVRWAKTLQEVAGFKAAFGTLPGDSGRTDPEGALRQWVRGQRVKADRGELAADRISALDRVDGDWRANRSRLPWEDNLAAAMLDYGQLGRIPGSESSSGQWLTRQRSRMSTGKLDADQLDALDAGLPGWRNLDRANWFERVQDVARYVRKTGRIPTSRATHQEAVRHYAWLSRQRKRLREGKLDDEQSGRLDTLIPGWRGRSG